MKLKVRSIEAMTSLRAVSTVSARKRAKPAAKVAHKIVYIRGRQLELPMCMSGWTLDTLGKRYEVRGNGADGSHWREKPVYGWVTHLPGGWIFTPAPGTRHIPDGRFYADFVGAFPRWTGGLAGTWSADVAKDQNYCASAHSAKVAQFCNRMR